MRYVVIENFCDMQDGDKEYKPGDIFASTNEARIKELASAGNKLGRPLIKAEGVEEPVIPVIDNSFMNEPIEPEEDDEPVEIIPVVEEPAKKRRGRRSATK